MSKFSTIARGTRGEKAMELPALDGGDGLGIPCLVRALNGLEEEQLLVAARERAIAAGLTEPKIGEPIYDLAVMLETIARACLDPDSPKGARELMFTDADEARAAYGREAIAYIYELQKAWQDEVSPTIGQMDAKGYIHALATMGGEDQEQAMLFFYRLEPGIRASFTRTMACQLWTSLTASSSSGSPSAESGPSSKSEAAS
jgi:hypothetical protein